MRWSGLKAGFALVLCCGSIEAYAQTEPPDCVRVAQIVSAQGELQIRRAGHEGWAAVRRVGLYLCQGDVLYARPGSRAALFIGAETVARLDQNSQVRISQTASETVAEFLRLPGSEAPLLSVPNPCGAGYFVARFPRRFRVITPFLNAAVEGTEFSVAHRCESSQLAVFEGRVRAQTPAVAASEALSVSAGEAVDSSPTARAGIKVLVKPIDAVQWALFYPPLSEPGAGAADETCNSTSTSAQAACLTRRAEQRLRSGRADEARKDIESLLALDPDNGDAHALLAVIHVVQNDAAAALTLAQRATQLEPLSLRGWIALSYAQQANFKLQEALASAERAAELSPGSSIAYARAAEMLMSLGKIRSAERAAQAAVSADPSLSRGHTVLGFVHLARIDTAKARTAFEAAIERDSADPLPRLGLGLVIIREGDLKLGREQIEIAVALDPANSLIRSYTGKAYYEENSSARDQLAGTQFELAKQLDPRDPTPWYYGAILKQTHNRPVEALHDLEKSIELNDNRAIYRSRLLLDQDRSARSVTLSDVYRDLGFDQLAIQQARQAISTDPDNYASHRFLADAYEGVPRQEVARSSEQLQALIRAPIGFIPVSPFRDLITPLPGIDTVQRPILPPAATPLRSSVYTYDSLYERSGLRFFTDLLRAGQDTGSTEVVTTGATRNFAFSAGYGQFNTDGMDGHHAFDYTGVDLFGQVRASDQLYLQGEFWTSSTQRDRVSSAAVPSLRSVLFEKTESTTLRIGARYEIDPRSGVYVSSSSQRFTQEAGDGTTDWTITEGTGTSGEAQYSFVGSNLHLLAGIAALEGRFHQRMGATTFPLAPQVWYTTEYLYAVLADSNRVFQLHGGVAQIEQEIKLRGKIPLQSLDPKIGAVITPRSGTTLRLAMLKSTRRTFIGNETLEPTAFAGFNQLWDDPAATSAWQTGLGLDQRLNETTYVGFELMQRELDVPQLAGSRVLSRNRWTDDNARAYLYHAILPSRHRAWLPRWSFALSVEYTTQDFRRQSLILEDGVVHLRTHVVPLAVTIYPGNPVSVRLGANYVSRRGLVLVGPFPGRDLAIAGDFWTFDASLSYRLPKRRGKLSLGISNAMNTDFPVIDSRDSILTIAPSAIAFARLSMSF